MSYTGQPGFTAISANSILQNQVASVNVNFDVVSEERHDTMSRCNRFGPQDWQTHVDELLDFDLR
jgi:hypothetical protein